MRLLFWMLILSLSIRFGYSAIGTAEKVIAKSNENLASQFNEKVQPLLMKYCQGCHSTKTKKGELDLQRFTSLKIVKADVKPWQLLIDQLESGEMPPKEKPQPTDAERKMLIDWTRRFLNAEARARAGDPGRVPLHRLSNTEYNNTIRDLTGVDVQPAREFPADGAAGEGFTNAAESLSMSPAMMGKYLDTSKKIASHMVLLPDGFRFSAKNTRRDWTDESLAKIRLFYNQFSTDGRLPLAKYLTVLIRYRTDLRVGKTTIEAIAKMEKLSPKYLNILWQALTGTKKSFPLDRVRSRWRNASQRDVPAIVAEVNAWRSTLWNFVRVGSYRYGNTVRQVPKIPAAVASQTIRLRQKPIPGQNDIILYLIASDLRGDDSGYAVWHRPRFESRGKPTLLLRNYDQFGSKYEVDYSELFGQTSTYLKAVIDAAKNRKISLKELAKKNRLDERWLKRWIEVASLQPPDKQQEPGRVVPKVELTLLNKQLTKISHKPAIKGWNSKQEVWLSVVSNSSNKTENIPGRVSPHKVTIHPSPTQFVAVVWKSPIAGKILIESKIVHAHNACGNGVAWWIEKQSSNRSVILSQGTIDRGKQDLPKPITLTVQRGDRVFLAVEARNASHVCDLTEVAFTLTEVAKPNRKWDLAADVANNILAGNPHSDSLGNKTVWSFVRGPIKARSEISGVRIPIGSLLSRWRKAAMNPTQRMIADQLAVQLQKLLTGIRPSQNKHPDQILYDRFMLPDGLMLQGFDFAQLIRTQGRNQTKLKSKYGFKNISFGKHPLGKFVEKDDLVVPLNKMIEVRLPAALFMGSEFRVEGRLIASSKDNLVHFHVFTAAPKNASNQWDGKTPIIGTPDGSSYQQLRKEFAEFRQLFPPFICFPKVIPVDEIICLKRFHREDEPLIRLFLDGKQTQTIDRLWAEHRFITKFPLSENRYLPQFLGFATQDQPKKWVDFVKSLKEPFRRRAEQFEREFDAAAVKQMQQLFNFSSRAFRRPLLKAEKEKLQALYDALRHKKMTHEAAFRNVLARVLISPSFLLHLENPPPGSKPKPVNDWELASRLSYFLWGSIPDEELRRLAAAGKLHDPKILEQQTRRMLKDNRVRTLAIEFGTQWIHVRGFDRFDEKNEKLFPTFDDSLRSAIYEESILFFQDLFQNNRPVTQVLDSDATFLNETLAKHYNITNVKGSQMRRVTGIRKYGRGGILGLASVQAKQSGASRTSPILRGNWVYETLLGQRLPRPPANVPQLPEKETGNGGLTMRQVVEKHVGVASCAVCHQHIDPLGYAFEQYDPIGRQRNKDLGGLMIDTNVTLKDGTNFSGINGLRTYLLTKKKKVVVRLFYQRLLGYALNRSVTLSDESLLDGMMKDMKNNKGQMVNVVLAIVNSPQFRMIRGRDFPVQK